jgi:hypothetical protein
LIHENGKEIFVVLAHVSETGSGKEEIKLFFCFLVGFYDSSFYRLFYDRFERKSSFFLIAGFFGFVIAFVIGDLLFKLGFLDLFVMLLLELLFEFLLKLAMFF